MTGNRHFLFRERRHRCLLQGASVSGMAERSVPGNIPVFGVIFQLSCDLSNDAFAESGAAVPSSNSGHQFRLDGDSFFFRRNQRGDLLFYRPSFFPNSYAGPEGIAAEQVPHERAIFHRLSGLIQYRFLFKFFHKPESLLFHWQHYSSTVSRRPSASFRFEITS